LNVIQIIFARLEAFFLVFHENLIFLSFIHASKFSTYPRFYKTNFEAIVLQLLSCQNATLFSEILIEIFRHQIKNSICHVTAFRFDWECSMLFILLSLTHITTKDFIEAEYVVLFPNSLNLSWVKCRYFSSIV